MQIVCPTCATRYEVEAADLGVGERRVRCARCRTVWSTAVPAPSRDMSAAPASAEATFRADPLPDAESQLPHYESLRPDGSTGAAPTTREPRIPATAWADGGGEPPSVDADERDDGEQTPAEIGAHPDAVAGPDDAAILADAPPLVPAAEDDLAAQAAPVAVPEPPRPKGRADDIESFAARRARREALRQRHKWLKPNLTTGIIVLVAMTSVLIGWRNDVVRLMPQTASFFSTVGLDVNLRGLAFVDVKTTREQHEGVTVLVVEGKIVSRVPKPVEVPRLRFAVRNDAGNEIYAWTALPTRSILGPGESLPFRSRLASPPPDTRTVLVRFFHRRDIVHGTR